MEEKRRGLNISKLKLSDTPISTNDALKGILPIQWSDKILSGEKKLNVTLAK